MIQVLMTNKDIQGLHEDDQEMIEQNTVWADCIWTTLEQARRSFPECTFRSVEVHKEDG